MRYKNDMIDWVINNKDDWEIICGAKSAEDSFQIYRIYETLCNKVKKEEGFDVLLLSLLTKYAEELFPNESNSQGLLAIQKYKIIMGEVE